MTYDVAVIGAGAMGASSALALARRGLRVIALEQFGFGHAHGSSHGPHRIIRKTYSEGAFYLPLLAAAYEAWAALERECGRSFLTTTGGLDIEIGGGGCAAEARATAQAAGAAFEELDAHALQDRFPAFRFEAAAEAIYAPGSGVISCDAANDAMRTRATALGAELCEHRPVTSWRRVKGGFELDTRKGPVRARKLVVAAGAWAGELLPQLKHLLTPERQVVGYFQTKAPERFGVGALPIFQLGAPDGSRYYGSPAHEGALFKFGLYHHRREHGAAALSQAPADGADEALLRAGLAGYLPDADEAPASMTPCIFTLAPDNRLMFGRAPGERDIIAIAACSGHGYKFAPVIGELTADLIEERTPALDIAPFALGAPAG